MLHQLSILDDSIPKPEPGGYDAKQQGCTCEKILNQYGHSAALIENPKHVRLLFKIDDQCPIKGHKEKWEEFQRLFG